MTADEQRVGMPTVVIGWLMGAWCSWRARCWV